MMMSEPDMLTAKTPTTLPVARRFDGNGSRAAGWLILEIVSIKIC